MVTEALKILAIDDSPDNLNVLKVVVRDALPGTAVVTALNGPQGLALARSEDPDVILLDIMMPEMDGYAVCRALKADDRLRQIPVVFLTALRADRERRLQALAAGAEAFLTRPLDKVELIAQIRAMAKIKAANQMQRLEREELAARVAERTAALEQELTARKRTEAALRESEERLRDIIFSMADWVWEVDENGIYTYSSQKGFDIFGPSREDLIGKTLFDFMPPDEAKRVAAIFSEIVTNKAPIVDLENWNITKSGERICLLTNGVAIVDEAGNLKGYRGVDKDITERKRAEQEVASLAKFPSENPNPVLRLSRDGIMMYANAASGALLGMWGCAVGDSAPQFWRDLAAQALASRENKTVDIECDGKAYSMSVTPVAESGYVNLYGRDITDRKRTDEMLLESELKFRTLFDRALDGILIANMETRRFFIGNSAICQMLGYTHDELSSIRVDEIHPLEHLPYVVEQFNRQARGEIYLAEDIPVKRKDGSVFYVDINTTSVTLSGHTYMMGIFHDITERRRVEAALRESEERFRSLFENATIGIYRTTPGGRIELANPALIRMLGYTSFEELAQRNLEQEGFEPSYPRAQFRERIEREGEIRGLESAWRTKDGATVFSRESAQAIRDAERRVLHYEGMVEDITEHKRAEEALRLSEEKYRTLVDEVNDGFYVSDGAGVFTFANPALARMYGVESPAALIGRKFSDFLASEMPAVLGAAYGSAMQTGRAPEVIKGQILRPDGIRAFIEIKPTMIVEGDQIVGTRGVVRDITARREAEETLRATLADLERSNADLERFAYVASHDLQEPLRTVASFVQLLGMNYRGRLDADADEFIGYAVEGAKRMQQVILDLLEYSRAGTRAAALRPTDTAALCDAVIADLALAIQENGATVICEPLPTVNADAAQLAQVFQHLIGNAIKFHGAAPPQVHISACQTFEVSQTLRQAQDRLSKVSAKVWEFAVHDNGIGIAAEYFERIFVIFQRLHTRDAYPGTGIGLAVCKRIVERHDGRIWVESTPGQGSTFYFTLPVAT